MMNEKSLHSESPEIPAWARMFSRVIAKMKTESVTDMCTVLESVRKDIFEEVMRALLERNWREVDRKSDEYMEIGRFCPEPCTIVCTPPKPEEIKRIVEEMKRILGSR